jgi:hypothetical protein
MAYQFFTIIKILKDHNNHNNQCSIPFVSFQLLTYHIFLKA